MNSNTDLKQNCLKQLMNYNDSNDTYMNANVQRGDVSSGIGLLNSHTLPQDNESSNLNEMNTSVENGDVNDDYCYMDSSTGSESNNYNSIDYIQKRNEIYTKRYLTENNILSDGAGIYVMLPASALNQYVNTE